MVKTLFIGALLGLFVAALLVGCGDESSGGDDDQATAGAQGKTTKGRKGRKGRKRGRKRNPGVSGQGQEQCWLPCKAVGKCTRRDGKCVADSDDDCRRSVGCSTNGYCSRRGDKCVALSDADCLQACKLYGTCMAKNDRCLVPATSSDICREPLGDIGRNICQQSGMCTARDGVCMAGSDSDCRQSRECKMAGLCSARDGECFASSEEDCQNSKNCQDEGMCTLSEKGFCLR